MQFAKVLMPPKLCLLGKTGDALMSDKYLLLITLQPWIQCKKNDKKNK